MNKNVMTVLVVILVPIVLVGFLAVTGAENFEKQKEAAEGDEHTENNATESAAVLVPVHSTSIPAVTNNLAGISDLRVLT